MRLLALVTAQNVLLLADGESGEIHFKGKERPERAVDTRVAPPLFLDGAVLFGTLGGKLVSVDYHRFRTIRETVISSEPHFANVIYLEREGESIIAATPQRLFALHRGDVNTFDGQIRDVRLDGDTIWVVTVEGEVFRMSRQLQVLDQKKFPFARFVALSLFGDRVILVEKEGYVLVLDRGLTQEGVYRLPEAIDAPIFSAGDRIYYDDRYIQLR